jgi:hypothetical protein
MNPRPPGCYATVKGLSLIEQCPEYLKKVLFNAYLVFHAKIQLLYGVVFNYLHTLNERLIVAECLPLDWCYVYTGFDS